jgi:hypothetical protein
MSTRSLLTPNNGVQVTAVPLVVAALVTLRQR